MEKEKNCIIPSEETTKNESWHNTRDLLQKALSDWELSEKTARQDLAAHAADQKSQKERLEKLLGLLKEKLDELAE